MNDDLTRWLDEEVYPRLSHELFFNRLRKFKRSGRGYVACCPVHDDKNPSFYMPDGKPYGFCYACGYSITWWQKLEELGFRGRQVIEELARMAGVPPLTSGDPEKARQAADTARQIEDWWQKCRAAVWRPEGADVLKYLRSRGYSDKLIREMDVGVHLGSTPPGGIKLPPREYRLLIPARVRGGRIIGFAGRRLDDGEPKYQYSSGLPRSSYLWGMYRLSRNEIPVVVEGVLDTESLAAAGIESVIALGGARASGEQIKALAIFPRVVLALDDDPAGCSGTIELVKVLTAGGVKTYVADFRGAKDPDELLRMSGPDAVRDAIKRAAAGHRWLVRKLAPAPDAANRERDEALEKVLDVAEMLSARHPLEAREMLDEASSVFCLPAPILAEAVDRLAAKKKEKRRAEILTEAVRRMQAALVEGKHDRVLAITSELHGEIAELEEPLPPDPADVSTLESCLTAFPEGLRFPWPALDALARIDPGGMTVIGAGTSHGKSTFLYALFLSWLEAYQGAIVFWSGEIAAPLIWARLVSILAGTGMKEIMRQYREGLVPEVAKVRDELVQLCYGKLYLWDDPISADELETRVKAIAKHKPVLAVFIDYLQMLTPPAKPDGSRYATREQEVTATAKALHELGRELNTAVVAAAQISRNNFQYAQRPRLTDLRESGGIEQYSQMVIGLWNASMAAGAKAGAEETVPAAPPEGWYWTPQGDGDSQDSKAALAMAASWGGVLLEANILKSRWRGNVGKSVPLLLDGLTGRISVLPEVPGPIFSRFQEYKTENRKSKEVPVKKKKGVGSNA